MNAEKILSGDDFKRCADFHGHICPGMAIGYRAALSGMDRLQKDRAVDEELISIVENNACGTDAVQVLTGCTFGKGNFVFKDYGKSVYTFLERSAGKGVRVALRPGAIEQSEEQRILMGKIRKGTAREEEKRRFEELHFEKTCEILEKPEEELFSIRETDMALPPKAKIESSRICDQCGEQTMASRLMDHDGRKVCGDCAQK